MNTFLRLTSLAATVAALALTAAPAQAASQVSVTPDPAVAKVKILKALTLTKTADLDFGTIVLGGGTWGGEVVTVSTAGVRTCGGGINLTCDTTPHSAAAFNVTGSNNAVVSVNIPASVVITNGVANLTVTTTKTIVGPTVTMPNSGTAGVDFEVGGSITLASNTPDGSYEAEINVTADYL